MYYEELRRWLADYGGDNIKEYENKVITDTRLPMYGICMPELRQMAKKLCREDWCSLFEQAQWDTYEEVLLIGLATAYAKESFCDKLPYIRSLLPHLDSWAHTDCIVPTLKIKDAEREAAWNFTIECLQSDQEYTIRFGIIMLMDYFLTDDKLGESIAYLSAIRDERYYVRMAVAWCMAEIAVKHPEAVEKVLKSNVLDAFTHNKTIQKMRESYRISPEQKEAVKLLKRKEAKK